MTCKRHPKYKAIRKPTVDCAQCHAMYAEVLRQKELEIKDGKEAVELHKLYKKLHHMNPSWREIKITKERFSDGKWKIESSVWMDNGYGGSLSTVSGDGKTLKEALEYFSSEVEKYDKMFSHRYM